MFGVRKRRKASLDCKLLNIFVFAVFAQSVLPINGAEILLLSAPIVGVLVYFAIRHRKRRQWQWQGLTAINILKGSCVLLGGLAYSLFSTVCRWYNTSYHKVWEPSSIHDCLVEIGRILPMVIRSKDSFSFIGLVSSVSFFVFAALVMMKVAYFLEEPFADDCMADNLFLERKDANFAESNISRKLCRFPLLSKTVAFFLSRYFLMQKERGFVRLEFFAVSSHDIRANYPVVGFSLLAALIFSYSTVCNYIFGRPTLDDFSIADPVLTHNFLRFAKGFWIFLTITLASFAFVAWRLVLRVVFAKRIIDFKPDRLVLSESLLVFSRRIPSISKDELPPLVEKPRRTTIPHVSNSALVVQRGLFGTELAGHLPPEAMDVVRRAYDDYPELLFEDFYEEAAPLCIK